MATREPTSPSEETVALVALLRASNRPPASLADEVEAGGSAQAVFRRELEDPPSAEDQLFAAAPPPEPARALAAAARDLRRWRAAGISARTILDPGYPPNLRTAHDRPPLVFSRGREDIIAATRTVAVIGTREPSPAGLQLAGDISTRLAALEYVVVSGMASGIDAAAHQAVLDAGGRTLAVIGTGLEHAYPPGHSTLQATLGERGAVLSQFWPDAPPRREHFPLRNALMSGLTRASIIIEAGERSGTRIQARAALGQGRAVFLHESLLAQRWARELAAVANVHVIANADDAVALLERVHRPAPLTA